MKALTGLLDNIRLAFGTLWAVKRNFAPGSAARASFALSIITSMKPG